MPHLSEQAAKKLCEGKMRKIHTFSIQIENLVHKPWENSLLLPNIKEQIETLPTYIGKSIFFSDVKYTSQALFLKIKCIAKD